LVCSEFYLKNQKKKTRALRNIVAVVVAADNPEDIRMLKGRFVPGNGRVSPLDGVPPSGSGMWCQAIIPAKATLSSAATPVLRQSSIVVSVPF
jgi:hypothetical protein